MIWIPLCSNHWSVVSAPATVICTHLSNNAGLCSRARARAHTHTHIHTYIHTYIHTASAPAAIIPLFEYYWQERNWSVNKYSRMEYIFVFCCTKHVDYRGGVPQHGLFSHWCGSPNLPLINNPHFSNGTPQKGLVTHLVDSPTSSSSMCY
jgi:hypothetical protein